VYSRIAVDRPSAPNESVDLDALKAALGANLTALARFARLHDMEGFAGAFDAGFARLNSPSPYDGAYKIDLAPDRLLPLTAAQLFGGGDRRCTRSRFVDDGRRRQELRRGQRQESIGARSIL